jgi:hypothetical protein
LLVHKHFFIFVGYLSFFGINSVSFICGKNMPNISFYGLYCCIFHVSYFLGFIHYLSVLCHFVRMCIGGLIDS